VIVCADFFQPFIFLLLFLLFSGGLTWMTSFAAGIGYWSAAAVSSTGRLMVAAQFLSPTGDGPGTLLTSTDWGQSWRDSGLRGYWASAAVIADGRRLIAAQHLGPNGTAG